MARSKTCLIILHLRHLLLKTKGSEQTRATVVVEDNMGAVRTSRTLRITPRMTHIYVISHRVRSLVADNAVDVKYIQTSFQKVDIFTKSVGAINFASNRLILFGE